MLYNWVSGEEFGESLVFSEGMISRIKTIILRKTTRFFISSVKQERLFLLCQIGRGLPNFKGAVVLPRSWKNLCQAWNLTDFSIYKLLFEGKRQSREFDLTFRQAETCHNIFQLLCDIQTVKMEDSYLGMPLDNQNSKNTFNGCQVHVSSSNLSLVHARPCDWELVVNNHFAMFQCTHEWSANYRV